MISYVYSIGHGKKTIDEFLLELHSFDIEYLIDIRSKPYSKYCPHFSQDDLRKSLEKQNIFYVYMGKELGGLPVHDSTCFTEDGRVDYDKLKEKDFFRKGMERLFVANSKGIRVCIMCSESNPIDCHRSKLIGEELLIYGIYLQHIIGISKSKSQSQINEDLTNGTFIGMFGDEISANMTSKKRYL